MKTKIHFGRVFFYLILCGVIYIVHDFLHSHLILMIMWIAFVMPFISIGLCLYVHRNISCKLVANEQRTEKGSLTFVTLNLINKAFFPSLNVDIKLNVENQFYNIGNDFVVSMAAGIRSEEEMLLPLRLSVCGILKYSIDHLNVTDIMGFVDMKKSNPVSAEVFVLPLKNDAYPVNLLDMNRGMTEAEESQKRGNDFSDVNEIREYIPGDKLMSIHWKLSAKRDILMVKDRVSMSDQQLVVLVDLAGNTDEVEEVLDVSYNLILKFAKSNLFVRVLWWSEARFEFEERQIISPNDVDNAFQDMLYEKIYHDSDKTKEFMRSIRPELKAYINVVHKEGEAIAVVVEQD